MTTPLVAYVVLAHTAPEQLVRLVTRLASSASAFFIHLDDTAGAGIEREVRDGLRTVSSVHFVPRQPVQWGHSSILRAMLGALEAVLTSGLNPAHVIFLSGRDYPIKPRGAIEHQLSRCVGWSFVPHAPLPVPWPEWADQRGGFDRFEYAHVHVPGRGIRRLPVRRATPQGLTLCAGPTWVSLSREHVEYVVRFARENRKIMRYFKHVLYPDESFMHTVLLSSPLAAAVKNEPLHFVRWSRADAHPHTLTSRDIPELATASELFARKFDLSVDPLVLDEIDRQLIGEDPQGS